MIPVFPFDFLGYGSYKTTNIVSQIFLMSELPAPGGRKTLLQSTISSAEL